MIKKSQIVLQHSWQWNHVCNHFIVVTILYLFPSPSLLFSCAFFNVCVSTDLKSSSFENLFHVLKENLILWQAGFRFTLQGP